MPAVAQILISLVAVFHAYVLWFEMFAWETRGPKVFRNFPRELFGPTKVLAANQGLYNGFLAAGLIWSLLHPNSAVGGQIATFFLICVTLAGLYGAVTASRKIAYVQALPAFLALLALHLM
jgi:putative membrane protein